jgi:cytochrome c-type biogenesis protein CcmE
MTRKQRRAVLIAGGLIMIGIASALVLKALDRQVTFFMSPTEVLANQPAPGTRVRIGGLVEEGTFHKGNGAASTFRITDRAKSLPVTFNDILPDLFKEGQGAVAEGHLGPDGVFVADTVLAKHDEKYMPPEVAAALKKSGRWQEPGGKSKAPAAPGT